MDHTWRSIFEEVEKIEETITDKIENPDVTEEITTTEITDSDDDDKDLLEELNQIFTPILVMQQFDDTTADKIQEAFSDASLLTEKNIIKFDDANRMAQLISVCALLLQKKKNTDKWKLYQKAAMIRNKMKLDIQKEEYANAKALAQKFLVKVSTTNNSSIARDAATALLPETQH